MEYSERSCITRLKNIFGGPGCQPLRKRPCFSCTGDYIRSAQGSFSSNKTSKYLAKGLAAWQDSDFSNAYYFYKTAAAAGDPCALHNLGTMLLHGQGVPMDPDNARECFIKASYHGVRESMGQLGYMYMKGLGVSPDQDKARLWFLRAAESGLPYAQFYMGIIYLEGLGVSPDSIHASAWLDIAAFNGFPPAEYNLGVMNMKGIGMQANLYRAAELFESAAMKGDTNAEANLGLLLILGEGDIFKDVVRGVKLLKQAAREGCREALYNLAECYFRGLGVEHSLVKAAWLYEQAALRGDPEAAFNLSCLYLTGRGDVEHNRNIALKWLEFAASQGHAGARHNIYITVPPRFSSRQSFHKSTLIDKSR